MTPSKKQWQADKRLAKEMGKMAAATKMLVDTIDKSTKPIWKSRIVWAAVVLFGVEAYLSYKSGIGVDQVVTGVFAVVVAALRLTTTKALTTRAKKEGK